MQAVASVKAMAAASSSSVECPICYEPYEVDNADKVPVLLSSCGHTFCRMLLLFVCFEKCAGGCCKLLSTKSPASTSLPCPLCCVVNVMQAPGPAGVLALPKNFALLELLGSLGASAKGTPSTPPIEHAQVLPIKTSPPTEQKVVFFSLAF